MPVDLAAVAAAALRCGVASATLTARTPITYDPYLPGRAVDRATGIAQTLDGEVVEWTAVVKRTGGVGLRAARRELDAYRGGIATPAPATGLRAPALLGWFEDGDHVELWLEALTDDHGGAWPVARFGVAARHIAAWDARTSLVELPAGFDSEDAWAERHGQPHRVPDALAELDELARVPTAGDVASLLDDPGFRRVRSLIESTAARIARLATYPQTPLHHDLVRSNLFALGDAGTAAIDWENVGRGPLGVDLAPLVVGSVRRGEASSDDLGAIERVVIGEYVAGLADAGIEREADARAAYSLAVGLRWHVVLGTIRSWLDPASWGMRGSRRDEPRGEALGHLVGVSRHILDTADASDKLGPGGV